MLTFTIARDNTSQVNSALTVNLSVSGTATFGVDYTVSGATTFTTTDASVVIPAGALSVSIVVTPVPDLIFEPDEEVILSIVPTVGLSQVGVNPSATGMILNDDVNNSITITSTLLLHFDSAPIVDSSTAPNVCTLVGGAQISTVNSKFGGASLLLAANSLVSVTDSPVLELLGQDFTIDFWIRPTTNGYVLGKGDAASAAGSTLAWTFGLNICVFYTTIGYALPTPAPPLNVFSHVEVSRQGGLLRYFLNGVLSGSLNIPVNAIFNNTSQALLIGAYSSPGTSANIDEFRIVVGSCAHPTNFTPPSVPYTN